MRKYITHTMAAALLVFGMAACGTDTENVYDEDVAGTAATGTTTTETPSATPTPTDTLGTQTGSEWNQAWGELGTWDTDADNQLAENEWDQGFEQNVWANWDADQSGDLSQQEWQDTWWSWLDDDNDGLITESEWNQGTQRFDDIDVEWADWSEIDADQDGQLGKSEFGEWWNQNAWETWDADGDGAVGRDEAADTFWDFFDGNDDGLIDANEWGGSVQT